MTAAAAVDLVLRASVDSSNSAIRRAAEYAARYFALSSAPASANNSAFNSMSNASNNDPNDPAGHGHGHGHGQGPRGAFEQIEEAAPLSLARIPTLDESAVMQKVVKPLPTRPVRRSSFLRPEGESTIFASGLQSYNCLQITAR